MKISIKKYIKDNVKKIYELKSIPEKSLNEEECMT